LRAIVLLALALAGCFAPHEPACAFSCGPGGACPEAYSCGTDNLCHRDDGVGVCLIAPQDAQSDAMSDAPDAASD
jgi:hypothetical protein